MIAYRYLGVCFRNMTLHDIALKCFKRQLDLAWYFLSKTIFKLREVRDTPSELDAYDSLGMEYFYLGDLDRASYYHKRMTNYEKEPLNSELRSHRHNFVFKIQLEQPNRNYSHLLDILMKQIAGMYQSHKAYFGDDPDTQPMNVLSQTTQKFFVQQRTINLTPQCSETSVNFYNNKRRDPRFIVFESPLDRLIISGPADLSFVDLPSPYAHSDARCYGIEGKFSRSTGFNNLKRSNSYGRMSKIVKTHCPSIIAYLNKKKGVFL